MKVFVALLIGISSALVLAPTATAAAPTDDTYFYFGWEDADGDAHCAAIGLPMVVDLDSDACPSSDYSGPYGVRVPDATDTGRTQEVIVEELGTGARIMGVELCVMVHTSGYYYVGEECSLGRFCAPPTIDPFHPAVPTCRLK